MSVTKACRDINELHPLAQKACKVFLDECKKAGLDIFITETYRSQERQNYLYEQGRTRKYDSDGKKLSVVTWTLNSNHKSRLAWDIGVNPPKDLYDDATLKKAGQIAMSLGIGWGGVWKKVDKPHFEVTTSWEEPKVKESVLPVKEIEKLQKQIDELKKLLTTVSDEPTQQKWATENWERAVKNGYFDGTKPQGFISREQAAKVVNTVVDNIRKYEVDPLKSMVEELEKRVTESGL